MTADRSNGTIRSFGLIPAAGVSRRMGQTKLALRLGERTILENVLASLRTGGVEQTLVVLGPATADLCQSTAGLCDVLILQSQTVDMRATVQAGLDWIELHWKPQPTDVCWMVPADQGLLQASTVRQLLALSIQNPSQILVPTFGGKRGHPLGLPWDLAKSLRAISPELGVNALVRQHADRVVETPFAVDVLCDIDTPEDFQRAVAEMQSAGGSSVQ